MNTQWVGIAVSVLVMLGGTAVNLFIIGRFVGQWGEAMKNIATTLSRVEERADEAMELGEANKGDAGLMRARLVTVEAAADKFWDMRDAFIKMTTTIEIEGKQQRDRLDSLARGQGVIERQLGNLVGSRAGFTTLTSEETNQ